MKITSHKLILTTAALLSIGLAVTHAQDANRGHGRGRGHGSGNITPGATPSFTPPGNHYGWDKGRGNPHHSPSPTATPSSPTPTPSGPTPTPDPTTPTPTPTP